MFFFSFSFFFFCFVTTMFSSSFYIPIDFYYFHQLFLSSFVHLLLHAISFLIQSIPFLSSPSFSFPHFFLCPNSFSTCIVFIFSFLSFPAFISFSFFVQIFFLLISSFLSLFISFLSSPNLTFPYLCLLSLLTSDNLSFIEHDFVIAHITTFLSTPPDPARGETRAAVP